MSTVVSVLIDKDVKSGRLDPIGAYDIVYGKTFGKEGVDFYVSPAFDRERLTGGLNGALREAYRYMDENPNVPVVTVYQPNDPKRRSLTTVCHLYREKDGSITMDKWRVNDKRTVGECRAGDTFVYLGEHYIRTNDYLDITACRKSDGCLVHLPLTEKVVRTKLANP